jgi:hypothetical protein
MDATLHAIEQRSRATDMEPARPAHFKLGGGKPVSPEIVINRPGWSLYCLDFPARQAIFVETTPNLDLSRAPFVFLKQYLEAKRALRVPFAALEALAQQVRLPDRIAFIFSIGRCGTTLANAMLNRVDSVWSLSEPDAHLNLVMNRALIDDDDRLSLTLACTRLMFQPPTGRLADTIALKFRSQSLFNAAFYHAAFPDAAFVFMYRDGADWARSFHRFETNLGFDPVLDMRNRDYLWWILSAATDPAYMAPFLDLDAEAVFLDELFAPAFALHLDEYLRLFADGVPFAALRYEELNRDRRAAAARLFAHCGLPIDQVPVALDAFERDSQEGTAVARNRDPGKFDSTSLARFLDSLARHPRINRPDIRLPDIYNPMNVV